MPTKKLSYKGYLNLLNRIAYWLVNNDKKITHPKEITINKKTKKYNDIITIIKKEGKKGTNEYTGRLMEYHISKSDVLPAYVIGSSGKTKYSKASYKDMVKRVVAFRKKNNKNPNTVSAVYSKISSDDSSSKTGLRPYLTNTGCSGMGQCTGYYCACNSLQQSFYRLTGIKVDEKTIAGWAGTTTSGTGHDGINTAVAKFNKKYNKNVKITWYNFSELGSNSKARWNKISEFMKKGAVFFHLLYRNKWGHYEVIKSVGDDLKILNSLGNQCGSGTYCGYIETRSRSTQESYISGVSQKSVAVLMNN